MVELDMRGQRSLVAEALVARLTRQRARRHAVRALLMRLFHSIIREHLPTIPAFTPFIPTHVHCSFMLLHFNSAIENLLTSATLKFSLYMPISVGLQRSLIHKPSSTYFANIIRVMFIHMFQ